ncbi:glutamine synthetase family protein [Olegusella massiliensis]|uniref:glutamine synthetase family protein n=1 Tax=Olegusella massiliensis TaxID=1776381 RepID=UPI0003ADFE22|nr:glutamine synthetase family protein [Olegusella massiliensis]ERL12587.1 glutamine synthetase, beta-grasp domain protein [Coriobacteriaceae bacterium BV3Ac1]
MSDDRNIDFVLRTVEKRNIRFIRLWFTDMLGTLKSFAISAEDLEEAFEEGIGFDGSSVDGFVPLEESDMLAFPDASTFQILPGNSSEGPSARIICDIATPRREPFEGDPRTCLKTLFENLDEKGYVANIGPRIEYFYFASDGSARPNQARPLDYAGYFDLTSFDSSSDLRRDTTMMLERMSVPVEYNFHSSAPSQNAVELRFTEALTAADNIITARYVIRSMAQENGVLASFMPRPMSEYPGSGMFLYHSLFDLEGNNVFWGPRDGDSDAPHAHFSELGCQYMAGLLKYAPEYTLICNPTINSYKRLVPSGDAPAYATWGFKNRNALVRVPLHKPGKHQSARCELRSPDPSANPYLAIAATLAAGMRGIEEGLVLPSEVNAETLAKGPAELARLGVASLPRTLGEALDVFEKSELMREVLGDHIVSYMLEAKHKEWDEYCSAVTDWERDRYYAGI